jgi:hypothetical protein
LITIEDDDGLYRRLAPPFHFKPDGTVSSRAYWRRREVNGKKIEEEEFPLAKAIEESDPPLQQERVSIVGEVREMDLDARRFALRHIEILRTNE